MLQTQDSVVFKVKTHYDTPGFFYATVLACPTNGNYCEEIYTSQVYFEKAEAKSDCKQFINEYMEIINDRLNPGPTGT